jgi:hydroxymethylbilane synthase
VKQRIVLGTRGSELALIQSRMVEAALQTDRPDLELATEVIKTSGDEDAGAAGEANLTAAGRKGLFTAEIERALIDGRIDVAVHSAKDLPSALGGQTQIAAALPRAASEDLLVSLKNYELESLPAGGTVATGSIRRRHQIKWKRPDVQVADLRGNVPTRLRKLIAHGWDAAILARAGLQRLGLHSGGKAIEFEGHLLSFTVLPRDDFVPAGGQGIIALQVRSDDKETRQLVNGINDAEALLCLRAEREFLRLLQADCDQPVGVAAILQGRIMMIRGQVFEPGNFIPKQAVVRGLSDHAEKLAAELLREVHG